MKIWVLGSRHSNIDKSILWTEDFEHFSNSDTLIINLTTLQPRLIRNDKSKFYDIGRKYLLDVMMSHEKKVIIILSEKHELLDWLPIFPLIRDTSSVNLKNIEVEPYLTDYMKEVKNCNYYIHDFCIEYLHQKINPKSGVHENYPFTQEFLMKTDAHPRYNQVMEKEITNQANQIVGGTFLWNIFVNYKVMTYSRSSTHIANTNHLTIIPPTTDVPVYKAIDLIINTLIGNEVKEPPPKWEKTFNIPGLNQVEKDINQKESEKNQIEAEIKKLKQKKTELTVFRRLLWTKNFVLEDSVKNAFKFLGFTEIRKIRAENMEDWVFDFQTRSDYKHGVVEVKGSDKRTSLANLTQCNKWVEDYMLENLGKVKGIFVPNQYRLKDPTDTTEREHFEPNEIEYATKREICILPAHQIFNAVIEKMKNNPEVTREKIEEKIATSNGLCKLA